MLRHSAGLRIQYRQAEFYAIQIQLSTLGLRSAGEKEKLLHKPGIIRSEFPTALFVTLKLDLCDSLKRAGERLGGLGAYPRESEKGRMRLDLA